MVGQFLTLDLIETVADTEDWTELDGGVPQGSSLTPLLFNMYIDKLSKKLARVGRALGRTFTILSVDDVFLLDGFRDGLHHLLRILEEWSNRRATTMGTTKFLETHSTSDFDGQLQPKRRAFGDSN